MTPGCSIHSGKTDGGLTFQDTMIDFEESVLDPWGRFLERVYREFLQGLRI